jgi:MFS transporter, MCT family, solute carrier family 16 (monocarboxylic acid transporters), member 10
MTKQLIAQIGFQKAILCVAGALSFSSIVAFFAARPNPNFRKNHPENWLALDNWLDKSACRNPAYCWFVAAICFMFFGFYAVSFNIEEWAISHNIGVKEDVQAGEGVKINDGNIQPYMFLMILNAASVPGRVSAGALSDKFGALNVHIFVAGVSAVLALTLWILADNVLTTICFVVFYGIVSGSLIGLPPASVAYLLGPDQHKLGQWTGMMYTMASVFALTGPVIAGQLVTNFDDYYTVQGWAGGCLFVSFCCMCVSRYYAGKQGLQLIHSRSITIEALEN